MLIRLFNKSCNSEIILPYFTDVRTHDQEIRTEEVTIRLRKKSLKRQLIKIRETKTCAFYEKENLSAALQAIIPCQTLAIEMTSKLDELASDFNVNANNCILRKQNKLFKGKILLPQNDLHLYEPKQVYTHR